MTKKRLLILGASGMLGFHCHRELNQDFEIQCTYNSNKIKNKNFVKFSFKDSTTSFIKILEEFQPDAIVNTTGLVSVDGCEEQPLKGLLLNSSLIDRLISDLSDLNMYDCHIVHISSAGIYGNSHTNKPWKESDITSPISVYGNTKLLGEFLTLTHKGPATVLRSDFYGINPYSEKSLLWWIIKNASIGETMDGWENIHFSPISAQQLAKIIGKIINGKVTGIFNVGCLDDCNKYNFVNEVCSNLSLKANVVKTSLVDDSIRPNYTIVDSKKIYDIFDCGLVWQEDLSNYMKDLPDFPENLERM